MDQFILAGILEIRPHDCSARIPGPEGEPPPCAVANTVFSLRVLAAILTVVLLPLRFSEADNPHYRYLGTGTCSSSNCHGAVNARTGSSVLQNEYHTWLKYDKHSQAFGNLTNADSKRMAQLLGIADAAKEPLCLKCHSTYITNDQLRGSKFSIEDGVTCESCHGAAEGWLERHTAKGTTHAENIKNGMRDLVPLHARAELCLSCHYGNDEQSVSHRLYGVGHPRLSFELDTFGITQPRHWDVDDDYKKRKAEYIPLRAWLVGQAVQAREMLKALESPQRSMNGLYPELSLFDCYSCHHSLAEDQWKKRDYGGRTGELKLNLPSLVILREAFTALIPELGANMREGLNSLHDSAKTGSPKEAISKLRVALQSKGIAAAENAPVDEASLKRLLKQLVGFGAASVSPTYEIAEQTGMGIQAIMATSPELAKTYKPYLDDLFAALKSAEVFEAEKFTKSSSRFLKVLS